MGTLRAVGPLVVTGMGPLRRGEPRAGTGALSTVVATTAAIQLDRTSAVPLYRQVEDQIRSAIHEERLLPGARLPGIRTSGRGSRRRPDDDRDRLRAAHGRGLPRRSSRVGDDRGPGSADPATVGRSRPGPSTPRSGSGRVPRFDLRPGALPVDGVPGGLPDGGLGGAAAFGLARVGASLGRVGADRLSCAVPSASHLDAVRGTRTDPGRIVVGSGPRVLIAALVAALDGGGRVGPDSRCSASIEPIDPGAPGRGPAERCGHARRRRPAAQCSTPPPAWSSSRTTERPSCDWPVRRFRRSREVSRSDG